MAESTRESLFKTRQMVKESSPTLMVQNTKENGGTTKEKAQAFFLGKTGRSIRVIGKPIRNRGLDNFTLVMGASIREPFITMKYMEMGFTLGITLVSMKGSGSTTK